jgi:hypothetical protein
MLFPNESSYRNSALSEGIEILASSLPETIEKRLDSGVTNVLVVGVFDAREFGTGAWPYLGAIRDVHNVEELMRLPSGP